MTAKVIASFSLMVARMGAVSRLIVAAQARAVSGLEDAMKTLSVANRRGRSKMMTKRASRCPTPRMYSERQRSRCRARARSRARRARSPRTPGRPQGRAPAAPRDLDLQHQDAGGLGRRDRGSPSLVRRSSTGTLRARAGRSARACRPVPSGTRNTGCMSRISSTASTGTPNTSLLDAEGHELTLRGDAFELCPITLFLLRFNTARTQRRARPRRCGQDRAPRRCRARWRSAWLQQQGASPPAPPS